MKFWVKVRIEDAKEAQDLIWALFQDFNPESSIVIKDKEAKLEIVFEDPPRQIVDKITKCEILEFYMGKDLTEYEENKDQETEANNNSEKQNSDEKREQKSTKQSEAKSKNTELPEQTKTRRGGTTKKKEEKTEPELGKIPELEEIAKKADSFEHFVKLVAEWIEVDKRQEFFEKIAIAATELDKVSWKEISARLYSQGYSYLDFDKLCVGRQVSAKLKDYSVTTIQLLKILKKYKEYAFEKTDTPRTRVKMKCMPEIQSFEEMLGSIDKSQPIEERVLYVLNAMGLNNCNNEEKDLILKIANAAVKKEKMDFDTIFTEANIPEAETETARMAFSQFINDFVKQYESKKMVKLLTFLSQLQKVIITESDYRELFLKTDS